MSLKIANARIREAILNGIPASGPPSLKSRWARLRYVSPEGSNAAYEEALKIINEDASKQMKVAESATDPAAKESALVKASIHNPEVKYNHLIKQMDLAQPVYKELARRDWAHKDMLILMQRLEQHHVIPDTLPTLDPKAEVKLRFVTPNMRFIEPGEWIANDVCSRTPQVEVRDYSVPVGESAKYTVLIVNPDIPDLDNDSFTPFLHFAATNVSASLTSPTANLKNAVAPYIPPFPEKNAPGQRLCVWVCRQSRDLDESQLNLDRDSFDVRQFVAEHELTPVGASVWRSKWDLSSQGVREKYNLGPGRVYFRARTAKPEEALLHVSERHKWMKIDGLIPKE